MTRDEALAALHQIVDGIDQSQWDPGGWWETSVGEEFGARKLRELEGLIRRLTAA